MKRRVPIAILVLVVIAVGGGVYRCYHGARTASAQPCWNRLRIIESAKGQWALETGATSGAPVTVESLTQFWGNMPTCHVSGATYVIGKVGEEPRCTIHGTVSDFKPDLY
jgi:hypothetical protein